MQAERCKFESYRFHQFLIGGCDKIIGKLKILGALNQDDRRVLSILSDWFDNYVSKDPSRSVGDLEFLKDWYNSKGLYKKPPGNIYRGVSFYDWGYNDYFEFLKKGYVNLKDTGYDSWTVDVSIGSHYASSKGSGVILSQKLRGKDYFDINKSLDYFDKLYPSSSRRLKEIYKSQCEIVTLTPCKRCDLKKNVECFVLNRSGTDSFVKSLRDLDFNDHYYKRGDNYWYYAIVLDKDVYFYRDLISVEKNFKLKPDTKCD